MVLNKVWRRGISWQFIHSSLEHLFDRENFPLCVCCVGFSNDISICLRTGNVSYHHQQHHHRHSRRRRHHYSPHITWVLGVVVVVVKKLHVKICRRCLNSCLKNTLIHKLPYYNIHFSCFSCPVLYIRFFFFVVVVFIFIIPTFGCIFLDDFSFFSHIYIIILYTFLYICVYVYIFLLLYR